MADIRAYIEKFNNLKIFVNEEFPKIVLEIAQRDISALIVNRVTQTQTNYKGVKFSVYSKTKLPVFFFYDAALAASGQGAIEKLKAFGKKDQKKLITALAKAKGPVKEAINQKLKDEGISYSEFRKLIGRLNEHKDFQLSGEMWLKFGIKREVKTGKDFVIYLGGTTEASQNKIDWNSKREGISIIENSVEEEEIIIDTVQKIFNDKIRNLGF